MMKIIIFLIVSLISFSTVLAQDTAEIPTKIVIKAGTQFSAKLKTEIDAGKVKVGEDLKFELEQDLNGEGGTILKGAEIFGRVVSVEQFSGKSKGSKIEIRFDFIRHGEEFLFLSAVIVSCQEVADDIKFQRSEKVEGHTFASLAGKNLLIESNKELTVKLLKDVS